MFFLQFAVDFSSFDQFDETVRNFNTISAGKLRLGNFHLRKFTVFEVLHYILLCVIAKSRRKLPIKLDENRSKRGDLLRRAKKWQPYIKCLKLLDSISRNQFVAK